MKAMSVEDRIRGAVWGALAGDALGVPVEFVSREAIRKNPVTGMRAYGTHNQPAGTWSDDGSLFLCTLESLCKGFDPADMGMSFLRWRDQGYWTPHGKVFDIGGATRAALDRIAAGTDPEKAGGTGEDDNGNGSLMRILPVALRYHNESFEVIIDRARRASAITHGHPRSLMACGIYCVIAALVLNGTALAEACVKAAEIAGAVYGREPFVKELPHFRRILEGEIAKLREDEIVSSGYVVATLEASLWCLMGTGSFSEALLKAVNLGADADTTGCVTGGLAGLIYGYGEIPPEWIDALSGKGDIEGLIDQFITAKNKQKIVPVHKEVIGDGLMLDDESREIAHTLWNAANGEMGNR